MTLPGERTPHISVRAHTYHDQPGYLISGRDRYDRHISIFARSKGEAERIRQQVKNNQEVTFDYQEQQKEKKRTMTIRKGSREAHERSLKAAETRRRNKANGRAPAFPASYHARPTQHVTRDLRLKQTPAKKQHPYKLPASRKAVHALSNIELQRQYNYWRGVRGMDMPKQRNADYVIDELKQEMRRRAVSTYGDIPRIKEHRARRGVKKQRGEK